MKKIVLPILLFFTAFIYSQSIDVNNPADPETSLTAEELLDQVFIDGGSCVTMNLTYLQENPDGVGNLSNRSWGYFDDGGTSFPFSEGIILSSGYAVSAEGPNSSGGTSDSGPGWNGDIDIETILNNQYGTTVDTNNATVFEFEFTSVLDEVSFEYIFASEEYEDQWECSDNFRDGFAFLVKGPGIPDISGAPFGGVNIAAIPGSANVPVSTATIHLDPADDPVNGFLCGGEVLGVNYFPSLYVSNDNDNINDVPIEFDGLTVSLTTATVSIIPGAVYTMKMVIADRGDTSFDSAVFLNAGSFNVGSVDIGIDLTVGNNNARCVGETYTIAPNITAPPGTTYEWQYEDPPGSGTYVSFVPPETNPTLDVTTTGSYQLVVDFAGICTTSGAILIEFVPPPVIPPLPPYVLCDDNNDGFFDFDLSVMDAIITGGDPNLVVTYHDTQANADTGNLPLPAIYTNNVQYNDVVYVRVESLISSCYSTTTLDLEVRDSPLITDPQPLRMCDYNNPGDGFEFFDLTLSEPEVLNGLDPTQYDIYYYEDITDAEAAGDAALTVPDYSQAILGAQTTNYQNLTNPQTIYVLVVGNGASTTSNPNGASGCYNIAELQLIVDSLPVTVTPIDRYELCDDSASGSTTDGLSTFDLTTWNGFITNSNIALTVIWFETLSDEAADNPIPNPTAFQNTIINEQTVFARVVDGNGCKVIVPLTLRVNPNPSPVIPTPLEVCDDDYDGFVQFTLTDKDIEIIGGEPDVIIEGYYNTQLLAENGDVSDHLPIPYTNVVANTEQVWARAENTLTGCYTAVPLQLVVNPLPALPQVPGFGDLTQCDESGDGTALFNLEDNTPYLNGGLPLTDMTYGYYDNQIDAQAGNPPIAGTTAFPSMGQTIWVRVENTLTGCFRIDSFELIVGTYPVITTPAEMEVCDDADSGSTTDGLATFDLTQNNALITGGDITLQVFYYETLADQTANNPIVTPESYQNTSNPQVVYISVYNQTGCSATTTITLNVLPIPTPVTPTDLEECDADNDGFAQFDLTQKDAEIIGGQLGVTVSYYVLESDAQAGTPTIPDPTTYQNINPNVQTIWARAEFTIPPNDSGCFAVVPLNLVVLPTPVIDTLPDLLLCDTDGNNEETFDLTQQEPLIYGTQDPTDFLPVTYYDNPTDAQSGTGNIAVPTAYTGTDGQVIYVRLEFIATGCYTIGQFTLQVGTLPTVVPPTTYQLCDDLGEPNDGITIFDLTTKNNEITAGVFGIDVRYYETSQDAQDDTNRIDPETSYQNQTNPQTLYVRIIDGNIPDCPNFTTLTIEVLPNPTPVTPEPIALCDDNNPGDEQEVFDLTVREIDILNGEAWTVTYHETLNDALSGTPQIATPTAYSNTSNPQTIYVRVTNPLSPLGCFEIVELPIIVNPLPDDTASVEDYIICEVPFDGLAEFDLTTKIDEILNGQDPSIYQVSFYESSADAQAMTSPIVNTTTHQNIDVVTGVIINPQAIYTGILNTETGCYIGGVQTFNLEVKEGAEATSPEAPFTICDNLGVNDGIATFDLTDAGLQSEILNGQDPSQYQISFYATPADAETGANPLPGSYVNIINPQVIYAVVTNDANTAPKCTAIAEVILKVEELPNIQLEGSYRLCLDANNNPIPEEEGVPSPPVLETGLNPNLYVFQWELDGTILFDEIGSSMVAQQGGTYTVTATELATGCSNTQSTTVTLSQPPLQYDAQVISGAFANVHTIEATATGLGSYVFSLDDGPFQAGGTFTDVSAGDHIVTIKDENGCGSVVIEVGVIDYPRYFTPNNDGYHDRWNIIGIATSDPTAKIYIFDRFGKLIKQLSPLSEGWDGTYNGNPLPSSDYWFRVEYTEQDIKKEFKGHFTLKR